MKIAFNSSSAVGFLSYDIYSSIGSIADAFRFVHLNEPGLQELQVGTRCEIEFGNEPMITAVIDKVRVASKLKGIEWTGRTITRDLIDCTPQVASGEWLNCSTKEIIQELSDPFGIMVMGEEGVRFPQFNIELDMKCSDIISELCIRSDLFPTSDSKGNLLLIKKGPNTSKYIVTEADNIEEFEMVADISSSYGSYKVYGQQSFQNVSLENATKPFGETPKLGNRQISMISPMSMDFLSSQVQAEWIAQVQEPSKEALRVKVSGSSLIAPNTIISVLIPSARVSGPRLVESMHWSFSPEDGESTTFYLVNPSKYGNPGSEYTGWIS